MTPLMPGAGPPPTRMPSVSATLGAHAIDGAGRIVGNEQGAQRADGDSGRPADARRATGLEAYEEVGPLRRGVAPVDGLRGTIALHGNENNARRRGVAAVAGGVPGTVRRDEESAAIVRRKRVGAANSIGIERRAHDRRVRRQLDERFDGIRALGARDVRAMVLFAFGPTVIGVARMRREIVEKLVRMPERQIVLAGVTDPNGAAAWIDGERDGVADAPGALRKTGAVGLHHGDGRPRRIYLDARSASALHRRVARRAGGDVEQSVGVRDRRRRMHVAVRAGGDGAAPHVGNSANVRRSALAVIWNRPDVMHRRDEDFS